MPSEVCSCVAPYMPGERLLKTSHTCGSLPDVRAGVSVASRPTEIYRKKIDRRPRLRNCGIRLIFGNSQPVASTATQPTLPPGTILLRWHVVCPRPLGNQNLFASYLKSEPARGSHGTRSQAQVVAR